VRLEQRLAALELQASHQTPPEAEELASLDNVERLLQDCRHLLEINGGPDAQASFDSIDHGGYPSAA
jgi:hypothetical protein